VLFAVGSGVLWGIYILVGAALGRRTTQGDGLALGMAVAALVVVPVGVAGWFCDANIPQPAGWRPAESVDSMRLIPL